MAKNNSLNRRDFLIQSGLVITAVQAAAGQTKPRGLPARDDCVFCRIVAGTTPTHKLWEDKEFMAFLDHKPITPGHTLLIPKQHFDYVFDMPESTYLRLLKRARDLSHPLKAAMDSKRVGLMVEGFGVAHVHVHLVPINKGGELTGKGKEGVSDAEFELIAEKIRAAIKKR